MILTRRIQLLINSKDHERVSASFKKLFEWRYACFRAANYIFTHYYLQEQIKHLIYLTEGARLKLADITRDPDGILITSRLNSIRRILVSHFKGQVPMAMLSSLLMDLTQKFNNEKSDYMTGKKVLPNYKLEMSIPFHPNYATKWALTENSRDYIFTLFSVPFRTCLGKDLDDKKVLLDKMVSGNLKLHTSHLQLKRNKIFLLAAFEIEKEKYDLDNAVIAEASLSIDYPVIVSIGKKVYKIGSREEFLYRRLAIQSARQRLQKALTYNQSGKGRSRKLKPLERFKEAESNYIGNRLHLYSKRLIQICVKHRAATLILTNQANKEEMAKEDDFLLRNWSYFELKQKIAYKAERAGIMIIEE